MKKQAMNWKNIYANYIFKKWSVPEITSETFQINGEKTPKQRQNILIKATHKN